MAKPLARYFEQNPREAVLTPISTAFVGSEKIGQAVQQVGQEIDQIAQREEQFWVQKQMIDLDEHSRSTWDNAVNNSTDGAAGFEEGYLGALESRYEEVRGSAPNGRARAALDSQIATHRNQQAAAARGFATQERYEYRKSTILQDADNLSQELHRQPGVAPWQPQGSLQTAPGLPALFQPSGDDGFYSSGFQDPVTGRAWENNADSWQSKYYVPRDFADGENMQDRSGPVVIGKSQVAALDWVTDQFGFGKLQINSGFRSGASNQERAESGPDGPHTHGRAFDVQVRHLPQAEKDRLYSLFKAAGANAFGFGEGVLHVEWREGTDGASWTYGNAKPYSQIAVAGPRPADAVATTVPKASGENLAGLRPFQPWERRENADGTHSTEITTTFQDATGKWVNAPSLWRANDGWVELDEEQQLAAVRAYEQESGQQFPRFDTIEEAEAAAQQRSDNGGSGSVPVDADGVGNFNQYPYLGAVTLTARSETGTADLASGSLSVVRDAGGTTAVGILGLNSGGLLPAFLKEHGAAMGVTAAPGSDMFTQQWQEAVRKDPNGAIARQIQFHQEHIVRPAQASMQSLGAGAVANDPRAIMFTSDLIVQYGAAGARKHIAAGKGANDAAAYVSAVTASTKASLDKDFATALAEDPGQRQGLLNRVDARAAGAMAAGPGGAVSTGNVPAWSGPLPQLEDNANFAQRMERLEATVDTIGGTPAQRREVKDQIRSQIVRSWLSSVADVNPSAAMAVLMSGRYDNELTIGDQQQLMAGTQSAYKTMEAEIRAKQKELVDGIKVEASKLFADEIAAVSTTGQGLGRLNEAHIAVATEKEKSDLAFAGFAYQTSKEISTAAADDLPAILEALTPSGEGFAEELRRYQFAQEQVAARMELQKNDPAAYALQQSPDLAQQWKAALASNDPAQVSSAIRTARAAQARLGIPEGDIRSMPQTALTSFEELLTKAEDADEAFANIMQLRGLLGSESASVIAEMEKAGMAKGWSEVSGLIDAGHMLAAKSLTRVVQVGEFGDDSALGVKIAQSGHADVARKIFDGRLRRKEMPGLMPTGKDEDLDMNVKEIIGGYLGDAVGTDGAIFNTVREAALSFYASDLPFGATLDGAKIEAAIDMVTGGILEFNGDGETGKFIAPVPGMTQEQFNTGLYAIDDAALEGAFIGYASEDTPLTRDDLTQMQLASASNGTYYLRWPGVGLARNEDGTPFVLDYRQAVQASRDRALQGVLEGQVGTDMTAASAIGPEPLTPEEAAMAADLQGIRDTMEWTGQQ